MLHKKKIAVYIDGLNLYHGINKLKKPYLKWLNLLSLSEKFIDHQHEVISKVYYFSSTPTHLNDKNLISSHQTYIEALSTKGVEYIGGNFKKKLVTYKNNDIEMTLRKYEEKETDVNISIFIVRDALKNAFDKFIIVSNDTDLLPAIKMAKESNRRLHFKLLTPPTYRAHDSLRDAVHPGKAVNLTEGHIRNSLFPDQIVKDNGRIINIPKEYVHKQRTVIHFKLTEEIIYS